MDIKRIKQQYRLERWRIKQERRLTLENAKERYLHELDAYYLQNGRPAPQNPPKRPLLEEIGNSVTHGAGSIFAIVAFLLMMLASQSVRQTLGAVFYFAGALIMFTMSALYHAFPHGSRVKRIFRRFDYSSIYLLIGATFAPILLNLGGTLGLVFFIVQWVIIATGITFVGVFGPTRLKWLHIPLYFILGWSGLMLIPAMLDVGLGFVLYIVGGGVIYSLGIIPFLLHKGPSHFIWHFFVLLGAITQWLGIYLYIYL